MLNEFSDLGGVEVIEKPISEDFSDLGGVDVTPTIEADTSPKGFLEKIGSFFRNPEAEIAKASNIYNLSKETGLSLTDTRDNYDILKRASKITGITPDISDKEYLALITTPMIAASAIVNPLGTAAGLLAYSSLDKVIKPDEWIKNIEQKQGFEFSDDFHKVVNVVDFIGKGLIVGGVFKKAPELAEGFLSNKIIEYKLPETIRLSKEQVRDIFQTGKLTTMEEKSLFAGLELQGEPLKTALSEGVAVNIPAQKLISIVDKPVWAKIKGMFGAKATPETTRTLSEKPTKGVSGFLEQNPFYEIKNYSTIEASIKSDAEYHAQDINTLKSSFPELTDEQIANIKPQDWAEKWQIATDKFMALHSELTPEQKLDVVHSAFLGLDETNFEGGGELATELHDKYLIPATQEYIKSLTTIQSEGIKKTSGYAKRLELEAIKSGIISDMSNKAEYSAINHEEQARKALELVNKDYEKAKNIALGNEQAPAGLKNISVYNAVKERAKNESDVNTIRALGMSGVSVELSEAAQTLGLAERYNPEDPVTAIKEISQARKQAYENRYKTQDIKKTQKETVGEIKREIKKLTPSKETWADFIKSIQC